MPNPRNLERLRRIQTLAASGMTKSQIARELDISLTTILHYERTRGLSIPRESPEARAERVKDNMTRFWARGAVHYTGKY